jgi:hypothetical protein
MLLFHASHVRIAIPTANMVKIEWGEVSLGMGACSPLENPVFLVDLSYLDEDLVDSVKTFSTPFGGQLELYLRRMEMDWTVLERLSKVDFSGTEHLAFVHSWYIHPPSLLPACCG